MTSTSKYIVQNYHKKSVELHKCYSKDGKKLIYLMGWRWASWIVTTSDGKPPVFKFDYVPGGNDRKDSINMDNCLINNIKEVKLNGLYDHWYNEVLLRDEFSKEEIEGIERIREENPLVSELIVKGTEEMQSKLYDQGPSLVFDNNGWKNYTSDSWIWGPILIEAKNGYRKIIIADENGNVSDFKADPEKIIPFFSDENGNVLKF